MPKEKKTIEVMIKMYCNGHHLKDDELCGDCGELLEYARLRLARCPFGEDKPTCAKCPVHCYSPARRAKIVSVMKYSPAFGTSYSGFEASHNPFPDAF